MRVLTVNAGSSTLKLSLLEGDEVVAKRLVERSSGDGSSAGSASVEKELSSALEELDPPDAVGHRVVHGGDKYSSAVRIDTSVRHQLAEFTGLAPLHQPPALEGIDLVGRLLPDTPAVACFDTAFHSTLPPEATTYALPADWRSAYGLRRYGFHGLSHAYSTRRAAELLGAMPARLVICHLGAGASLSAVLNGACVDTTMGFTPLEGLVMATRSGDVDPGILTWLLRNTSLDADALENGLQHRSGLAGLAGTGDMREVIAHAADGDVDARLALDVYLHRLRGRIGAMVASLGGLDALVFTGGIGENAAGLRADVVAGLRFLGLELDPVHNSRTEPDAEVGRDGAAARCLVIAAREDLQIAAETRELLG
ncbi:acetate/propionate family kinase [Flindersiella endophytica]